MILIKVTGRYISHVLAIDYYFVLRDIFYNNARGFEKLSNLLVEHI